MTLDWKPGGGWHTQLSVQRTVAQLDFYDFISFGELSTQPDQWRQRRICSRSARGNSGRRSSIRLFGDGLFKLDLGHDLVSMLQDRVLICELTIRRSGRIASTRRATSAPASATSPALTLDAPLTQAVEGPARQVHRNAPAHARRRSDQRRSAQIQRLFSRLAVGPRPSAAMPGDLLRLRTQRQSALHFLPHRRVRHELQRRRRTWTAFVEYRPSPDTAVTLDFDNVAQHSAASANRLLFFPNRAEPDPIINEFRERNRHISIGLTLKQSFGGARAVAGWRSRLSAG